MHRSLKVFGIWRKKGIIGKGLYSKGKNFPNPVIIIKIVVIQKKSDTLSGFLVKLQLKQGLMLSTLNNEDWVKGIYPQ